MPDLLLALLIGLVVLVGVCLALRWAARAEKRADDRFVMARVYYPTRGRKAGMPPFRRRRAAYGRHGDDELIDLDVDEWNDRT